MDIFVGSLPFKLKEAQLKELFEEYGEVSSVKIIINAATRQNKGFGFVEMPNDKQAYKAIQGLHGSELDGRTLIVTQAEQNKDTKRRKK